MYEDKTRKFSKELKKLQELNLQSEEELQKYEIKFQELQSDLLNCQDRNRHGLSELTAKEEELVVHKVELSSLQEKFRAKVDEVRKLTKVLHYICLTSLTRAKCGIPSTLCWKIPNISGSIELFAL